MASTSVSNFLSFSTPPKPPLVPKTPLLHHLSLSSIKNHNLVSLASANDGYQSHPSPVMMVVCPSLAYANTLYFKSAYNLQVIVEDDEPEEKLLGQFWREVMRAGVIQECKRRRFFENKQEEKKRKTREAVEGGSRQEVHHRRKKPPIERRNKTMARTIGTFLKEVFHIDIVPLYFFSLGNLLLRL